MYRYKDRKRKKKIIIIISVILITILALFYSLKLNRKTTIIERGLKDIVIVVEKIVMTPFTFLNTEKNVNQNESYLIQKNVNNSLEKEIQELKSTLKLNNTLTEYNIVNATILNRNKEYYFNTITIDKGSHDGIKEDMAVITSNGLIGKVIKTTFNSSEVKLITSDDLNYKVSVMITTSDGDIYGILSGYDNKTNTITVTGVDKSSSVKEKDIVLTSGLGGLVPRGIYVGEVVKIKGDRYNLSKTLYIKTKQDFNSIHYVTVLKEHK